MTNLFTDDQAPVAVTRDAQIRCIEREIQQRLHVYPRLVARATMTQEKADEEITIMRAVRATLKGMT